MRKETYNKFQEGIRLCTEALASDEFKVIGGGVSEQAKTSLECLDLSSYWFNQANPDQEAA